MQRVKHGGCAGGKSSEYTIWLGMLDRCRRTKNRGYVNYGGRGITVADTWFEFSNFIKDMGERPTPKHTLERVDNSVGYTPENCIWATRKIQANNQRHNVRLTLGDECLTIAQWAERLGVTPDHLYQRHNRLEWSVERVLGVRKRHRTMKAKNTDSKEAGK